jgi:hypothetical protein
MLNEILSGGFRFSRSSQRVPMQNVPQTARLEGRPAATLEGGAPQGYDRCVHVRQVWENVPEQIQSQDSHADAFWSETI